MVVAIPVLVSSCLVETVRFYGRLGFTEEGCWPGEYLILRHHADIELHFTYDPGVESAATNVSCYIRFTTAKQARSLYDAWAELELPGARLAGPTETDYGMTEFALVDPHGNLLRVGGPTPA